MTIYQDYIKLFDNFQYLSPQIRLAIFAQDLIFESDPSAWMTRLESPGFIQGPGVDALYCPIVSHTDFGEAVSNRLKECLGTQVFQQFQQGIPDATSSPCSQSVQQVNIVPPNPVSSGTGPSVSFAPVTVSSTPVSAAVTAGHRAPTPTVSASHPVVQFGPRE